MNLQDKVAIITGSASGIGKQMAIRLSQKGAIVVIADLKEGEVQQLVSLIQNDGQKALGVRIDITIKSEVEKLIKRVVGEFGQVDILINSAGILHATPIESISEEEWDRVMAVNLKGTFLCCQAAIPYMKEKRYGRIINMASNAGRDGGVSTGLAYSASKAGVIGLTRGLAKRLAAWEITCNCIAPGTTESDMLKAYSPEVLETLRQSIPLRKFAQPEDLAELACFIASDNASFMTGAVVDINGGLFIG